MYGEGITVGRCTIVVPQGWYVNRASFAPRLGGNTLAIGERVFNGPGTTGATK